MSEDSEVNRWDHFLDTFFRQDLIEEYSGAIGYGMIVTSQIAVLVVVSGIAMGLFMAIIRAYKIQLLNIFIIISVDVLRSLPPLVLILLFYYAKFCCFVVSSLFSVSRICGRDILGGYIIY